MRWKLALTLALLLAVGLAPLAASPAPAAEREARDLRVTFMGGHVGAVLETPGGKVYVLDPNFAAARDDIAPYLKARGVKTIDGVLLTHPHIDHFSGIVYLVRRFRVKRVYETGYLREGYADPRYARNVLPRLRDAGVVRRVGLKAGGSLNLDAALQVDVLAPPRPFRRVGNTRAQVVNNNSLILWIRHGRVSFLLPGDSAPPAQRALAVDYPRRVRDTSVFLLPHHGRRYFDVLLARRTGASTPKARVAFANADARPDTVKAWRARGLKVYEARKHGAMTVTSKGERFVVETERTKLRRGYPGARQ